MKWFVIIGLLVVGFVSAITQDVYAQASSCRATNAAPTYAEGQLGALSCDLTGTLRTAGGGGGGGDVNVNAWGGVATTLGQKAMASSVPVTISTDQSSVPASQSGTWTVQPGNTANTTPWLITNVPSSATGPAITPVVSPALETGRVLKASAGNLYSLSVTTTSVSGYVMTFNSTTVPAAGAVTPIHCIAIDAGATVSIDYGVGPPAAFSTGISAAFSTTGCFTKTDSATAFFNGAVK